MNSSQLATHNTIISAVILDLDGTLLDTEQATRGILEEFLKRYGKDVDMEKENKRLGMIHKDTAIAIVKDYELPITPAQFTQEIMPMYHGKWMQARPLPGANRLIKHLLSHGVPFALASNSVRKNIEAKLSYQQGWREYFSIVLGSDQVKSGKPSPDIFLEAAAKMGVDPVCCLVIEDSVIGVTAGKAAGMKVVAVPSLQSESEKYSIAESVLHSLLEFQPELWGLPPFKDWVSNALPIEPIYFKGLYKEGLLNKIAENGRSSLPNQVSGLFFGWAKINSNKMFKIVISIKWDHGCCSSKRIIKVYLIDGSNEEICDQWMQLLLVGYIGGLCSKGSGDIQVHEDDKLLASSSLDLPAFAHHTCIPFFSEIAFGDNCSF